MHYSIYLKAFFIFFHKIQSCSFVRSTCLEVEQSFLEEVGGKT